MTDWKSRERVSRTPAHQELDHPPFDAIGCGLAPEPAGLPEDGWEYCRSGEFRYLTFQPPPGDRFRPFLPDLPARASSRTGGIASVP